MKKSYPNLKATNHPKNTQWKLDIDPNFIKTLKGKAANGDLESKRSNSPYCQGIDLMPIMTSASRSKSSAFLHFGISLNKYFIASKIFTSFTLAVQSKL
jgi:hypothetical protein